MLQTLLTRNAIIIQAMYFVYVFMIGRQNLMDGVEDPWILI